MTEVFPAFHRLGLSAETARSTSLTLTDSGVLDATTPKHSLLPAHHVVVTDPAALRDLLGGADQDLLAEHLLPMTVTVFGAQDITILAGQTLTIKSSDGSPVVVNVGTLTLEEGGRIVVESPVQTLTVATFIKKPASPRALANQIGEQRHDAV